MNNLVIGNTSQLSHYFPDNYEKISSRNIDHKKYENSFYDRIYITFAEQRTYIENDVNLFMNINVEYTLNIIDFFKEKCNKIIFYSTIELWNNCIGEINIKTKFNYNYSPYIESKEKITTILKNKYSNKVIILYPTNFNSIYRKGDFLFSKIFESIINKTKIEIGDTYFYRDIVHPKFIVNESLKTNNDSIIASGRLIHINDFIRILYQEMGLKYEDYVTENFNHNLIVKRNIFYLKSKENKYKKIIQDTVNELKENKFSK